MKLEQLSVSGKIYYSPKQLLQATKYTFKNFYTNRFSKMQSVSIFLQVRPSLLALVFAVLVTSSFNFLSGCFNVSLNLVAVPSKFR